MRTSDIFVTTAKQLNESIEKIFGKKLNLESFDLEQLQDARNKLRTQVSQARGAGGFNETLENDTFTQAQWMLDAINSEIAERQEFVAATSVQEGGMDEIAAELGQIADDEDYDKLYDLFSDDGPIGKYLQDQIADITMETGLHPKDDFERIEGMIMDRIQQEFGGQSNDVGEATGRDAYQRDYDSSVSGMGRRGRENDEGNTEPPNNFAIYINGKKWKVFAGRGTYADDHREKAQYQQLRDMAAKKSAATGKKWTVSITGEPATESISNEAAITQYASPYREKSSNDVHADPDPSEYDREGEMAKGQLNTGEEAAEELRSILDSNEDLPEWVQSKITLAVDYLDTARDYMKGQHKKGVEPTEDINTNEAYINNAKDAVDLLANLRKQSKMAELGQGDPVRPNQLVNDLWDVMQWIEHNMKESIGESMRNLREGEIQQASAIVTAKTMVDRVGRWIEELSGMENDTLLTLGDSIRDEMGAEQAKQFISACAPAIQAALENLKSTRETLSTGVRALTGEEQGAEMLGGEPAGDEMGGDVFGGEAEPDAMNPADGIGAEEPVDDFAAAEPGAGGLEAAGREKRESIDRSSQLLKVLAG